MRLTGTMRLIKKGLEKTSKSASIFRLVKAFLWRKMGFISSSEKVFQSYVYHFGYFLAL